MAFFDAIKRSVCTIGDVQVDAEIRTMHGKDGTLTEHPVEAGSPITDHYRVAPPEVEIDAIVSDTPIGDLALPGVATVSAVLSAQGGDRTPSQAALEAIAAYFDNAEIITIRTRRTTYENMVLTSFAFTDEASTGNALRFTLRAKQVRLVSTETGFAIERPKKATHQKKKSAGKGATESTDAPAKKSILKSAQDALAGAFP